MLYEKKIWPVKEDDVIRGEKQWNNDGWINIVTSEDSISSVDHTKRLHWNTMWECLQSRRLLLF